jgi:hypothetical protein
MSYGKIFDSMFNGSLYGTGALNFAIMGYVIAHMRPDKKVGMQVELNPRALADILGEDQSDVEKTLIFLCSPDEHSRTKDSDGKRLIRLGQFDYQVVNGLKYRAIRDEEQRREQNRAAQDRFRKKKHRKRSRPIAGEIATLAVEAAGYSPQEVDAVRESTLPEACQVAAASGGADEVPVAASE